MSDDVAAKGGITLDAGARMTVEFLEVGIVPGLPCSEFGGVVHLLFAGNDSLSERGECLHLFFGMRSLVRFVYDVRMCFAVACTGNDAFVRRDFPANAFYRGFKFNFCHIVVSVILRISYVYLTYILRVSYVFLPWGNIGLICVNRYKNRAKHTEVVESLFGRADVGIESRRNGQRKKRRKE